MFAHWTYIVKIVKMLNTDDQSLEIISLLTRPSTYSYGGVSAFSFTTFITLTCLYKSMQYFMNLDEVVLTSTHNLFFFFFFFLLLFKLKQEK